MSLLVFNKQSSREERQKDTDNEKVSSTGMYASVAFYLSISLHQLSLTVKVYTLHLQLTSSRVTTIANQQFDVLHRDSSCSLCFSPVRLTLTTTHYAFIRALPRQGDGLSDRFNLHRTGRAVVF